MAGTSEAFPVDGKVFETVRTASFSVRRPRADAPGHPWNRRDHELHVVLELLSRCGAGLREIYVHHIRFEDLYQLAEGLINLDADCMLWRTRHLKVIERTIGAGAIGSVGTSIDVMAKLTKQQFFPALWEIRSQLTDEADKGPLAY
ncbi:tryptophan 2,3-dioxygenase family protein [Amycolatopsis decaplanina]|uniref:Uncharacterized protein n=1 Tax=Amycolatopsis decaplanina DSM 44594 TaxID=1284240 RepID=M2X1W4_9PSEU|nr:tryptophan 2,3-dioxygenase family protein [Amycolatopsis decaplanina]EME55016.1 hypothetical protein H074_25947 [Amycolatopsis decaplanina DSM 44594]